MNLLHVSQTDSTLNHLKRMLADNVALADGFTIRADFQTAGRGQAGNGWESEQGRNLLFTTLFRPEGLRAIEQFRLSMLVSVGVAEVLQRHVKQKAVTVKWPNDVYCGDRKISGILIEHELSGEHITRSMAGVGINVNQEVFRSDAPNPVSLRQITGRTYDLSELLEEVLAAFHSLRELLEDEEVLRERYQSLLYRREGWHPYVERTVSLVPTALAGADEEGVFWARFVDVDAVGQLVLEDEVGRLRRYHFKEVRFVI